MAKRIVRVGSRESALAVAQTQLVMETIRRSNPQLELELVTMKTTGDKILDKSLDKIGGKGLFVKELDRALLESFPPGYRHLAYLQTQIGYAVKRDMPGLTGPEVEALQARGQAWLRGSAAP